MSVLFRYLNSIMILLIPSSFMLVYLSIIFKFHYDSINSFDCFWLYAFQDHNLNSIMILLILLPLLLFSLLLFHLNSIMILLILFPVIASAKALPNLNSIMILLILLHSFDSITACFHI